MSLTDSELIARTLAADDRSAFGELVSRHQSSVRKFLRHLSAGDHAQADDLAQETFLCAYRGLHRFRAEASVLTWLLGIARNQWRNARRRRAWVSLAHPAVAEPTVASAAPGSDLRHDLALALDFLGADQRLALHLAYHQGLTQEEIAVLLDWPLGTVKTQLARGKQTLRRHLAVWNPQT